MSSREPKSLVERVIGLRRRPRRRRREASPPPRAQGPSPIRDTVGAGLGGLGAVGTYAVKGLTSLLARLFAGQAAPDDAGAIGSIGPGQITGDSSQQSYNVITAFKEYPDRSQVISAPSLTSILSQLQETNQILFKLVNTSDERLKQTTKNIRASKAKAREDVLERGAPSSEQAGIGALGGLGAIAAMRRGRDDDNEDSGENDQEERGGFLGLAAAAAAGITGLAATGFGLLNRKAPPATPNTGGVRPTTSPNARRAPRTSRARPTTSPAASGAPRALTRALGGRVGPLAIVLTSYFAYDDLADLYDDREARRAASTWTDEDEANYQREFGRIIAGAAGSALGGTLGAIGGGAIGALGGPVAPATVVAGGVAGGAGGAVVGQALFESIFDGVLDGEIHGSLGIGGAPQQMRRNDAMPRGFTPRSHLGGLPPRSMSNAGPFAGRTRASSTPSLEPVPLDNTPIVIAAPSPAQPDQLIQTGQPVSSGVSDVPSPVSVIPSTIEGLYHNG